MPNRCSAPGCRSNYTGEPYTPVFKLPRGPPELVQQWLKALCREGVEDLKNIHVCAKHFSDVDIETTYSIAQADGTITTQDRSIPKLRGDSVPKFLPNCPSYLSSIAISSTRLDKGAKDQNQFSMALHQSLEQERIEKVKFYVQSLQDLQDKINPARLPNDWVLWHSSVSIYFIKPRILDSVPTIEYSLTINESLVVSAFAHSKQVTLPLNTISDVRQIEDLLEILENIEEVSDRLTQQQLISNATNQLRIALSNLDSTSTPTVSESTNQVQRNILPHLQFIINQLENLLVLKNHRRYNLITLVLALKCQLISPACYRYLQSLDCISLPHHSTLQRLYSNIGLDSEFTCFLQQSTIDFNYMERCVIMQMDEVHVKSEYTYKGGKIIGAPMQPDYPAKTVFAIMVSSLCKKWSTIVRLIPCSSSSAKELYPIIKSVINDIENCNLTVEAICTDNYPMNVSLFKLFSPIGILETVIPHPFNSDRSIVLLHTEEHPQ